MITIENNTNLDYSSIGIVIDRWLNDGYEDTQYVGKEEYFGFVYRSINYECKIITMKRGLKFIFSEIKNKRK